MSGRRGRCAPLGRPRLASLLAWLLGVVLAPLAAPLDQVHPAPAAALELPAETTVLLWRGVDCGEVERVWPVRWVRRCAAEERAVATLKADGQVLLTPLDRMPPRLRALPFELALQWHTCPPRPLAPLEQGAPWVPYEDPLIARCYVYRPRDQQLQGQIAAKARLALLDEVHPWLRDGMQVLITRAAAEGIEVRVISTVRPASSRPVIKTKVVLRKGKPRKVRVATGERKMGMHPLGLAVDINLGWARPMRDPFTAYQARGETYRQFETLGRIAAELGIGWLGRTTLAELGHFEHHPGWWGSVRGAFRRELLRDIEARGVASVWRRFVFQPGAKSPFTGLRE